MIQYHDLLRDILRNGIQSDDRTGVGTLSVFGRQLRFDLSRGFPAITTKKLSWRPVVGELLWFLEGSTNERRLAELTYGKDCTELADKTTIWTENVDAQGKALGYQNDMCVKELGPVYGAQWRNFGGQQSQRGKDQVLDVLNQIKTNPNSRRIIMSAWNPNFTDKMALPPCHVMVQFRVNQGKLHSMMTQRSADCFLGIPFNIASYALLTHLFAREANLDVGDFILSIGDAHIYKNHIEQVEEQLSREAFSLPTLEIDTDFDLISGLSYGFQLGDSYRIGLVNYQSHPAIKAPMAV